MTNINKLAFDGKKIIKSAKTGVISRRYKCGSGTVLTLSSQQVVNVAKLCMVAIPNRYANVLSLTRCDERKQTIVR